MTGKLLFALGLLLNVSLLAVLIYKYGLRVLDAVLPEKEEMGWYTLFRILPMCGFYPPLWIAISWKKRSKEAICYLLFGALLFIAVLNKKYLEVDWLDDMRPVCMEMQQPLVKSCFHALPSGHAIISTMIGLMMACHGGYPKTAISFWMTVALSTLLPMFHTVEQWMYGTLVGIVLFGISNIPLLFLKK